MNGDRRLLELWRFTCEGYLGELTREYAEKEAALEAELEATVDGETIPFRMLRPAIANEPDRERRGRLEAARTELGDEHLNPVYLDESWLAAHAGAVELGAGSYLELYRDRFAHGARAARGPVPGRARRRPSGSGRSRWTASFASAPGSGSTRPRAGTSRASSGRSPGIRSSPRTECCPRSRPRCRARDRPAFAGERPPRRRAAAAQDASRVLRADRGSRPRHARDPAHGRPG